ncbi:DUF2917 domain-containing protein [Caenimonas sedimenti]|uniref:DUF2917 domain-containing protein n=1 Tax=Caenimonas sedimenti TaxID=2596921 RepID=A0A562ZRH4_9BURK|nr:DUF2917 domain-containing protein [Caenimonas sedimenti]TWO71133.1 DUF2917 domain-containing protein [Caenimonas sedimenti]
MNIALNPLAAFPFSSWVRALRGTGSLAGQRIVPAVRGPLTIDKGATLVVGRAAGTSVTCVSGSLWITHDGDVKDVLLDAGDTYHSERSGRMLVHGLAASSARVS